jgi:hypothetical protein
MGAKAYGKVFDALHNARGSRVIDDQKQSTRDNYAKLLELYPIIRAHNPEVFDKNWSAYELSMDARAKKAREDPNYPKSQDYLVEQSERDKKVQEFAQAIRDGKSCTNPNAPPSRPNSTRDDNAPSNFRNRLDAYFQSSEFNFNFDPLNREYIFSDFLDITRNNASISQNPSLQNMIHDIIVNPDFTKEDIQNHIDMMLDAHNNTRRPDFGDD